MSIDVNQSFINRLLDKWDEAETTELLDALRVELRRSLRGANNKEAPAFQSIIEQMDNREFWVMLNVLYGYEFNP